MRTTLTIDDHVLAEFKRLAAESHHSLSGIIEDALREHLARLRSQGETSAADLPVVSGGSLVPGVDASSNAALQRALDEGLPVEKQR